MTRSAGSPRAVGLPSLLLFSSWRQMLVARHRRLRIVWSMVAVCLLAYFPAIRGLSSGAWPFEDDALGLFRPWREFARQAIGTGTLPLWNPHIFCGLPFM